LNLAKEIEEKNCSAVFEEKNELPQACSPKLII